MDSAIPLCRWPLPRLCGFPSTGCCRRRLSFRPRPLFELVLSFRVLPSCTYPAATATRSSHGLSLPTALERIRGPLTAGQSLPATFRLQGLATLLTAYSLESRAGFVSHRLRSWDSPFGGLFLSEQALSAFPPQANLPTVDPAFDSAAEAPDRYDEFRLPGSSCRECLVRARRFRPARRQRLPWVLPLQGLLRRPWPRLLPASSHVLCGPWRLLAEFAGTSEYRSAFAPPCPMSHRRASPAKATPVGSLHLPGPEHWGQLCPGYWFTSRSGRALLPAHRSLSGHLAGTLP
jgi:hypothetical protein